MDVEDDTEAVKEKTGSGVWKLYVSRALTSWGDRLWSFGLGLLLFRIYPDNLRVIAAFGITNSIVSILSGSVIGNWIDDNHRLKAAKVFLVIQNIFVALDCCLFAGYFYWKQEILDNIGDWIKIILVIMTVILALVSHMASAGSKIVIEKDWIVVIAGGDEDKLANLNAIFRTIDLVCLNVAPALAGLMFNYASSDKDTSYTLTAGTIALWNIVSVVCEYLLLISIYKQFPDLSRKESVGVKTKTAKNKLQKLTGSYDGWKYYFQHKIRNAGLGLAFLFMTVLGFDSTTWAYSLMQCVPESILGVLVAVSAMFGIAGALAFPHLRRLLGSADRVGVLGMVCLVSALSMCVVSVWLPGSPFDLSTLNGNSTDLGSSNTTTNFTPILKQSDNATENEATDVITEKCDQNPPDMTSVIVLLSGIIAARFGLWLADLSVTQILQENVEESKRGAVGGVQSSLNSSMNLIKFCLVLIMPMENTFGLLVILSFIFICFGAISLFCYSARENNVSIWCQSSSYQTTNTSDDDNPDDITVS